MLRALQNDNTAGNLPIPSLSGISQIYDICDQSYDNTDLSWPSIVNIVGRHITVSQVESPCVFIPIMLNLKDHCQKFLVDTFPAGRSLLREMIVSEFFIANFGLLSKSNIRNTAIQAL